MLLLFFAGETTTVNDTYQYCSSTDPDVLDIYVDGVLVERVTST